MKKGIHWKNSIHVQLAAIFILLLITVVAASVFINSVFLQGYYISNKQKQIEDAYDTMNRLSLNYEISSEEYRSRLDRLANDGNLSVVIADPGMNILCTTERESDKMITRLLWRIISGDIRNEPGSIFDMPKREDDTGSDDAGSGENKIPRMKEKLLTATDNYRISTSTDPAMRSDYIELWGYLDNGNLIFIRTPLESIRESVSISNRFMLYITILIAVIGAVVMWFVSRRITEPILELTDISDRMAHMDFDAKYTSGGKNEIGQLGEHMNEMSLRLEESIAELKSANAELQKDIEKKEQIESMRSEFISNVSHELKTPIALISGYAEGLRDGIASGDEDRDEYLGVIIDESEKMGRLVSSLMELNHIEYGNDPVEMKRFDLTGLISGILASSDIMIKQYGAQVAFDDTEPLYVWSDEMKTETVFTNLLTNAVHYCKGEKKVDITLTDSGDDVRVQIFNTGDPIPEESMERIWDKFYKVDKARTREVGGSGVGLSIVKAVMETLNKPYGVINYDNGVGFWFELERGR